MPPSRILLFIMNNYEKMQEAARLRFLEYDFDTLSRRFGVELGEQGIKIQFLGQQCYVNRKTGEIFIDGRRAGFGESLCIYDWLCDRRDDAQSANRFCSVHSLPGVFVAGSGLELSGDGVAPLISQNPKGFLRLCKAMDGKQVAGADLAVIINAFPDLRVLLKFYEGDEEFSPSLVILWDANILQFIRYETIYYLAGCLLNRIRNSL